MTRIISLKKIMAVDLFFMLWLATLTGVCTNKAAPSGKVLYEHGTEYSIEILLLKAKLKSPWKS